MAIKGDVTFIRFLKVVLFVPLVILLLLYYLFSPLWFILWNYSLEDVQDRIEYYVNRYDGWD